MPTDAARAWGSALLAPSGPGRGEALMALARAGILLFSAAALTTQDPAPPTGLVAAHLALAGLSVLAVWPLARLRTACAAERAARASMVVDLLAYAGYAALVDGRPGLSSLYVVFVLLSGPVRWGLRGALATGVPVGLIAQLRPMPDATGASLGTLELWTLTALLSLSTVAVTGVWRRSGARLRQAQTQFEAAFEHASIGMALLDRDQCILQANAALAGLLGVAVADLHGTPLADWAAPGDREGLAQELRDLPGSAGLRTEVRFQRSDGSLRWGLVAASYLAGSAGVPPRVVAQVENVHSRKSAEARLEHQAQHDALTGLPNRYLLLAQLEGALAREEDLCLVFLDLDRFKVVNDGLGHAAGDRLLVEVAARLRAACRPGDVVARLGGDEFVVLCHAVRTEQEARAVAERVLSGLRAPVRLQPDSEVVPLASAGVALSGPGSTAETLLRDADTAMYGAKAVGGGVRVFTPDLHQAARRIHDLEVDLRRALAEERLSLVYQPVVDVTTGSVVELEALVRWDDETRGPVSPTDFIAVAEQTGLIDELGAWVLSRALADAARWPAGRRGVVPGVAVNVSARQLLDPAFAEVVAGLLAEHGLPADRLWVEVTETALVEDARDLVPALEALRDLGVRLAIDDFGTGHASLTYLAQLPVHCVKVDQSFVAGVADEAGSAAIVGGVVAMAGAFGLTVVAEGVETAAQLQRLRRLGVDRVQGFLLSVPLRDAEVHSVLAGGPREDVLPPPRREDSVDLDAPHHDTAQRFRMLFEAARDVTACVDVAGVMATSFAALRRLIPFTGGSIQLVDGDVVRLSAADPPPTEEALAASIPIGTGVSGGIVATGEPRYLPDITIAGAVTSTRRAKSASAGVRSWYGVPLVAEGRIIGVLQVDSTEVDAFPEADRLLVLSFASVVASSVQTARLFAQELDALQRPQP